MTVLLVCTSVFSFAQSQTVKGKVLDNEGLEVIGGSVFVKGMPGGGTVTDLKGNYEINVNDAKNAVLVFSCIGYETIEVELSGRSVLDVVLATSTEYLEEAVEQISEDCSGLAVLSEEQLHSLGLSQFLPGILPFVNQRHQLRIENCCVLSFCSCADYRSIVLWKNAPYKCLQSSLLFL